MRWHLCHNNLVHCSTTVWLHSLPAAPLLSACNCLGTKTSASTPNAAPLHCFFAGLQLSGHQHLCQNNTTLRRLILMRNPFIDQANVMQVEILKRLRRDPDNETLRDALLISINALASGMRNTG